MKSLEEKELYNFVIGKRSKNDFKDDVRSFLNTLVKIGHLLFMNKQNLEIDKLAKDNLRALNISLHKRRKI